jgi:hypothetical protein
MVLEVKSKTTKEVGHIIDKFKKTFEAWQNSEFELYDQNIHSVKLVEALKQVFKKEYILQHRILTLNRFIIKMKYLKIRS